MNVCACIYTHTSRFHVSSEIRDIYVCVICNTCTDTHTHAVAVHHHSVLIFPPPTFRTILYLSTFVHHCPSILEYSPLTHSKPIGPASSSAPSSSSMDSTPTLQLKTLCTRILQLLLSLFTFSATQSSSNLYGLTEFADCCVLTLTVRSL